MQAYALCPDVRSAEPLAVEERTRSYRRWRLYERYDLPVHPVVRRQTGREEGLRADLAALEVRFGAVPAAEQVCRHRWPQLEVCCGVPLWSRAYRRLTFATGAGPEGL